MPHHPKEKENEQPKEAGSDLPQLLAFDKNYFYKLYIPDLLADILLVVFSFLASHELFSNNGLFYQMPGWQIIASYCIVVLTLPWYLGYLYVRNSAYYGKGFMKITLWIFVIMTFMILVHLVRLVFTSAIMTETFGGLNAFMGVFAMFLLVLGPMMCMGGASSAYNSFKKNGEEEEFDLNNATVTGALFIVIMAIAFMILIIGMFPENSGFGVVMLGYFGGPVLAVIVFGLLMGLLHLLNKIGIYKYLAWFAKNSFPFFIVAVLVFWSGVAIHFMINDFASTGGKISKGGMLFSVCISGLVPFRIIMLFNAPLRIANMVIGILSLGYFLVQVILLTN